MPSGSVKQTPSGGVTPTTTQGARPTPTGTPTPVPTVTPTAPLSSLKRGDFNCDGSLTGADGVVVLAAVAGGHPQQTAPCQPIGATVGRNKFGDINCDGVVDAMDALLTIKKAAGLTVTPTGNCPDFGGVPDTGQAILSGESAAKADALSVHVSLPFRVELT